MIKKDTIVSCTTLSNAGRTLSVERYLNGEFDGKQIDWFENGKIKQVLDFSKGKPVDTSSGYFVDGKLQFRAVQDGICFSLSKNGDTMGVSKRCGGKLCGTSKSFHPSRRPASLLHYNDSGKKHGLCETWREDGTRIDSIVYDNGTILEYRAYFYSGKIRQWEKTNNGKADQGIFYDLNGKTVGRLRNGTGIYIVSSEDNTSRTLVEYKDGEEVASRELKPGENPRVTR